MVLHTYDFSTQEEEARGSEVQGPLWPHKEFDTGSGYRRVSQNQSRSRSLRGKSRVTACVPQSPLASAGPGLSEEKA